MIEEATAVAAAPRRTRWSNIKELLFGPENGNGNRAVEQERVRIPLAKRPVTVSIMNQKGGCGKTTTVVNLAAALAVQGHRVLVVDMDPQAHASIGLGVTLESFRRSICDLLLDPNTSFGDVMRPSCISGLDVLPSSVKLSSAQLALANAPRGELALRRVLADAEKEYEFIFIDCPPTLNLLTLNALSYSKKVLIPVQTHYYALEGMKELFRTVEVVRKRFNPDLKIFGILATLYDKRVNIASEMLEAIRDHFKEQMFRSVIHNNVKLIEAPMLQQPVIIYAPRSSAASDFHALAQEVVDFAVKED